MRDKKKLEAMKGVFPAFNTPFRSDDSVDTKAAATLAQEYSDRGVDGLYLCGSTGEGIKMNVAERKELTEAVMAEVGNRVTVIVHVGAPATRDSVDLARHAAQNGVAAISAVPSIYYRLNDTEISAHWRAMMEVTDLPFVIYNIPGATGYNISPALFSEMAGVEQVYGIKNSNMNAYQIMQFRQTAGNDFVIFNGPDEQYLAGRVMGADGGIGGSYGVMPELFVSMERAIQAGDMGKAREIQDAANQVIQAMYALASFCGAAKEIIKVRFTDIGEPRMPQAPLTTSDRKTAAGIAKQIEEFVSRF